MCAMVENKPPITRLKTSPVLRCLMSVSRGDFRFQELDQNLICLREKKKNH